MKLATIRSTRNASGEEAALVDEAVGVCHPLGEDMLSIIRSGAIPSRGKTAPALSSVEILAPIRRPPRNIFCVGKNYRDHAREFSKSGFDSTASAEEAPSHPIIFSKVPECVIGPGEPIRIPSGVSEKIDYEAEIAIVIGKGGRSIKRADALDHVFGYTIINDVTARDLQLRHKQWLIGKSLDTFCPMGPFIVTSDAMDAGDIKIRCQVNGELRQEASSRDLIFDIPSLIESISAGITLFPGDIIATGTPAGVGIGFEPPRYLQAGDEIVIDVDGIGRLANRVK